jgi:hypothetical protein
MLELIGVGDIDQQRMILFDDIMSNGCMNDYLVVVGSNNTYGLRDKGYPRPFTSRFPHPRDDRIREVIEPTF